MQRVEDDLKAFKINDVALEKSELNITGPLTIVVSGSILMEPL